MRSLLVLIDGLGDSPISAWQGQTPFEHAVHPAMDALAASGTLGSFSICENDIIPESCSCILRLLGVDKKDIPRNVLIWSCWRTIVIFPNMKWCCAAIWLLLMHPAVLLPLIGAGDLRRWRCSRLPNIVTVSLKI